MALYTKKGDMVPPGFVPLTEMQAADFQLELIKTISKPQDCLAIKYGSGVSSILTAVSSTYIHKFYRDYTKIGNTFRATTFVAIPLFSSLATLGLQSWAVRDSIIINKWNCSGCYEMRSSFIQVLFGVGYPVFAAAFSSFAIGRRMKSSDDIPALNRRPIWQYFLNSLRPRGKYFAAFLLFHFLYGNLIAYEIDRENNYFNKYFNVLVNDFYGVPAEKKPAKS